MEDCADAGANRKEFRHTPVCEEKMENKMVCGYCGTIYDEKSEKCPLCGSTHCSMEAETAPQRTRITDEERKEHRRAAEGKAPKPPKESKQKPFSKEIPRKLLVATVVFLALSVVVVLYFIGDMIGWWPGLEDVLNQDQRLEETVYAQDDPSCTFLNIAPEELQFTEKGQVQQIQVAINASCEEPVYFASTNEAIAIVGEDPKISTTEFEQTSIIVDVTAVGEGETFITITCGEKRMNCVVNCAFVEPTDQTQPTDEVLDLELDYEEVILELPDETITVHVKNLADGEEVVWSSSDESVATVDENGKITAIGKGRATVTAEAGGRKAEVAVRCDFDDTVGTTKYHLELTDVTIAVDESFTLRLYDSSGERVDGAIYHCEDLDVCSISGSTVTGQSRGTTEVRVSYGGESHTCIVRVG